MMSHRHPWGFTSSEAKRWSYWFFLVLEGESAQTRAPSTTLGRLSENNSATRWPSSFSRAQMEGNIALPTS
jgi:hypothetical protein